MSDLLDIQEDDCLSHKISSNENNSNGSSYVEKPSTQREVLFGIDKRINECEILWTGVLKKRYSDFIVNEIDPAGNVLHLTDFYDRSALCEKSQIASSTPVASDDYESGFLELSNSLSQDSIEAIKSAVQSNQSIIINEPFDEKQKRTSIHATIKKCFSHTFKSETLEGNKIRLVHVSSSENCDPRNDAKRVMKFEQSQQITHFLMHKENRDTMECVGLLAQLTKTHVKRFSFAGTKDRRAITVQAVSAKGISAARLSGLNKILRGVKLGNYSEATSELQLGELKGNYFQIILRDLSLNLANEEKTLFEKCARSLKERGFINYFGLQRFGTGSVSSCEIGESLLKKDWKEAFERIMQPRTSDTPDIYAAKEKWLGDHNTDAFLAKIPKRFIAERAIAHHMDKSGNKQTDYLGAIQRIPRELRMLYVHSFQSLLWNKAASIRFSRYGIQPVAGDLVQQNGGDIVIVLDGQQSQFDSSQIVLPLLGESSVMPDIAELKEFFAEYQDIIKECRSTGEFNLKGSYRNLFQKPADFTWEIISYANDEDRLLQSDLDVIEGNCTAQCDDGPKNALKLTFKLPSSSYATICMREIISTLA